MCIVERLAVRRVGKDRDHLALRRWGWGVLFVALKGDWGETMLCFLHPLEGET